MIYSFFGSAFSPLGKGRSEPDSLSLSLPSEIIPVSFLSLLDSP